MKSIEIYITYDSDPRSDCECHYFFSASEASEYLSDIKAHLTAGEKKTRSLYAEGYTVRIPDEYQVSTAQQLDLDLCNGDLESPGYDVFCAVYISKQIFYKEIL